MADGTYRFNQFIHRFRWAKHHATLHRGTLAVDGATLADFRTDFDDNEDSLMVVCENAVKTVCTGGSKNEGPLQNVRRSRPQSASWLPVAGEIGCDRRSENEPCAVPVVTPACRRGLQSRQVSRRYPCEAAADRSWQSPRSLHSTMRCPEHLCAQGYP